MGILPTYPSEGQRGRPDAIGVGGASVMGGRAFQAGTRTLRTAPLKARLCWSWKLAAKNRKIPWPTSSSPKRQGGGPGP